MYIEMSKILGRPVAHYESGDLLVSDDYKGEFLLVGAEEKTLEFSLWCFDEGYIIPVTMIDQWYLSCYFRPFMENEGFYK